jgi:uncharacterized protein YkwD
MNLPSTKHAATIGPALAALALCGHGAGAQNCAPGNCARPAMTYQPAYYGTQYQAPRYAVPVQQTAYYVPAPAPRVAAYSATYRTQTQTTVGVVQGGGQVFLSWLNATRAQYGLPAVSWDEGLAGWAQQNNQQQVARDRGGFGSGLGHWTMGAARRQNAGWNYRDAREAGASWMTSPGHRAALLDPTIRRIGLARMGSYWTYDAS